MNPLSMHTLANAIIEERMVRSRRSWAGWRRGIRSLELRPFWEE
jgi:hypothetical protein